MEALTYNNHDSKNWFARRVKKNQVITFTIGFLLFYHFSTTLILYFSDKEVFEESYKLNFWFWLISLPIIYFLQWIVVTWIASKHTKESLKEILFNHPIVTIILFTLYLVDLPIRLSGHGNFIDVFEVIVYYAYISFLWWLLVCWISGKIVNNQRLKWLWYRKVIDIIFVIMPAAYKLIIGLIVAMLLIFVIFILVTVVFNYSGQDLKMLFS